MKSSVGAEELAKIAGVKATTVRKLAHELPGYWSGILKAMARSNRSTVGEQRSEVSRELGAHPRQRRSYPLAAAKEMDELRRLTELP